MREKHVASGADRKKSTSDVVEASKLFTSASTFSVLIMEV
jgi:hypothetical protein